MHLYTRNEAIRRINALAAARIPFLFVIDYGQRHAYVEELVQVDASLCRYDFCGVTNVPAGAGGSVSADRKKAEWHVFPPSLADYERSFALVKRQIRAGNSYLTNLTCQVPVSTNLTLEEVFFRSHALYRLWLKGQFVCFSPEIFVRIEAGQIKSYPMKGTIDATLPDARRSLMDDAKEAAEHATIVDLIRNDLSMVAERVRVARYRYCDRLETNKGPIFQTSSEICGTLPADYPSRIGEILFRLLPAGSITGAPKPRTCAIIAEAEGYERGFYTGIMGWSDGLRLDSAVMIRFLQQEEGGGLCYKAGGGITSRSDLQREYQEMIQKVYLPIE